MTLPREPGLDAQVLLLVPRLLHLRIQPLGLALQRRQALLGLRHVVARIARQRQQVHGMAPVRL